MKLKSNALYFEIHPSRSKPIGYIRNSYREYGKVRHQTVAKLHGIPLPQLQAMKSAFDGKSISVADVVITDGKEYGASATLYALAKKIGLDKIIYSRNESWVNSALAMIVGRIVYQGSKLSLSRATDISHLWEICGVEGEVDVDKHCYEAMMNYIHDKVSSRKNLQTSICKMVHYCPVAVEVFSGNTSDKTTVVDKIDEIKNTYGISDFIFVGDRGMLTQKNIDERPETLNITGLTHAKIKELCGHEKVQLSMFDEDTGTEVVLPESPGIRYILRKNPILKIEEQETRISLIEKTEALLKEIATPKKKTDDKTLAARATKIFVRYKTEKYFTWDIVDTKIQYSRKESVIADEEQYDVCDQKQRARETNEHSGCCRSV